MWKIGNVEIENQIIAAPLAGISKPVYRSLMREYGAGLCVSEMISDKALRKLLICAEQIKMNIP